jgi:T5orf172 domain
MRVFATGVWGFNPEFWAAQGFAMEGTRNKLASIWQPDDWVLQIATETKGKVDPALQGRLMGLVKVGTNHIKTESLVEEKFWQDTITRNGGQLKWEYGLPIIEAMEFTNEPKPRRKDVLPRIGEANLFQAMATHYVELTPGEAKAVLDLPCRQVSTLFKNQHTSKAVEDASLRQRLMKSGDKQDGPVPAFGERENVFEDSESYTYCMELGGSLVSKIFPDTGGGNLYGHKIYKIGWAVDPNKRLRDVNNYFPNLNQLGWKILFNQKYSSRSLAYETEQKILDCLNSYRLPSNREMLFCAHDVLWDCWRKCL